MQEIDQLIIQNLARSEWDQNLLVSARARMNRTCVYINRALGTSFLFSFFETSTGHF
jgi:hypothetical protein